MSIFIQDKTVYKVYLSGTKVRLIVCISYYFAHRTRVYYLGEKGLRELCM
jgi:hypothetical protein